MRPDRAQSESIGVVLLTGVVVVAIAGSSAVILTMGAGGGGSAPALVDLGIDATTTNVTIEHSGGDGVAMADSAVIVRDSAGEHRYAVDRANVTGDGDDRFEPGERFERAHGISGDRATVLVVDTDANDVLARATVDVVIPEGNRDPTARFTTSPDTPDPGATVTLDARSASDPDGSITSYEWALGDGSTKSGQTITHSYASAGRYTVELTVTDDSGATATTSQTVWVTTLRAPDEPTGVVPGVTTEYYEGTYTSLPPFGATTPRRVTNVSTFDISGHDRGANFAYRYTGYVNVSQAGSYTFYTESDDGSRLYIGDQLVVDNGGTHDPTEKSGSIGLQPGRHNITVTFFEHTGGEALDVRWEGPGINKQSIPAANLSSDPTPLAEFEPSCSLLSCSFDATGSTGTGSKAITSYEWTLGDGTTTTSPTVTHSYASEGDYTVELTVTDDAGNQTTVERTVSADAPNPPANPSDTTSGLNYSYYEDGTIDDLGDLQPSVIIRNGTTDQFDLDPSHREENFGFRLTGYVEVPQTGEYTFYTTSDDGSRLFVDGERVVNNDGLHSAGTESGNIALEAGKHPITVTYFEHTINDSLSVRYEGPGVGRQVIPASALSRDREVARWESTSDWDSAVSETGVVHESFGDRQAARVQLGPPTDDSDLSGYWPLDEDAGGTADDASPSAYDGTVTQVTAGQEGVIGTSAYDFGDNGWVEVGGFPNLNTEVTISAWINTADNTEQGQRIFADDEGNGQGYALSLGDGGTGRLRFYSRAVSPISLDTGRVIENDRWYHVVAVMDEATNTRQIYVNGTLAASDTYSGSWGTDPDATSIGGETDEGETENRFDGRVDEVRVYDSALSVDAVDDLHNTSFRGTHTTGTKTFTTAVGPTTLELRNVSTTRPAGTEVNVTVLSDPDGDSTFEESSDNITLDSSNSYDVTGLSSDSQRFRLVVTMNTTDPTVTPTVDQLELAG